MKDINSLIEELADNSNVVRMTAAVSLGNLGDKKAVEPLIKALQDEYEYVRINAALALGNIGDKSAVEPLIKILEDQNEELDLRGSVIKALGELRDNIGTEPLIKALDDVDWNIRRNAAEALGKIGDVRAVGPLIKALQDKDWWAEVHASIAIALGELGDKTAVEPLINVLRDKDFKVRMSAAKALGKIGDESAAEALTSAIQDTDKYVSKNAEEALGNLGKQGKNSIQTKKTQILLSLYGGLFSLGEEGSAKEIIKAMENPDVEVRKHAAAILGDFEIKQSMEGLSARLEIERDAGVKEGIISALKKLRICLLGITINPPPEMFSGEWGYIPLTLTNQGDVTVKEVSLRVRGPLESVDKKFISLRPHESKDYNINVKPKEPGQIPIELEYTYEDEDGNEKSESVQSTLQVKTAHDRKASTNPQVISGGINATDSVVTNKTTAGELAPLPFTICPFCGKKLKLPKTPNYCPYCEEKLVS
jgi:HEAT repeat protein